MSFVGFAQDHGLDIDSSKLWASDKIRRCGTVDKPKSDNGAFFWDGQRGWVMNWATDAKVHWWNDKNAKPWTTEEKREWVEKRKQSAKKQQDGYAQAAVKAQEAISKSRPRTHIYLTVKGFPDETGLVLNDRLIIPMRNVRTNDIQGYQEIWWNLEIKGYSKKMLYGMRAKEAVYFMGKRNAPEFWLVEGYATGLSVRDALKKACVDATVVVCFSANNMVLVANILTGRKFIFADNDSSKTGETAAKSTGCKWTIADEIGDDANDIHRKQGLLALMRKIIDCRTLDKLKIAV